MMVVKILTNPQHQIDVKVPAGAWIYAADWKRVIRLGNTSLEVSTPSSFNIKYSSN